jgi:hypothetical protein
MAIINSTDKPGAALAEHLLQQSEQDCTITPMDAVVDAARAGKCSRRSRQPRMI